ncbi:hypothetical protein BCO37747_06330 [Burkholderia contaminans]|jgi:hypothetical protein|uniref:Uncharacterized protein n=1 Tax=Burkholderia aenigmatica TaxID=2015348 RepID=A0A6J5JFD4_9BURK|nr:hypothetical protein BLA3211_05947 [Burkholderia aenigmatica]VWD52995.1 hypothetical protein BCO37747_06330 [Burkholderia contaminans]
MSEAIHPSVVAKRPSVTAVRTGPFVVRHLAPGKPYLQFREGRYFLVQPRDLDEIPYLPFGDRLRFRINQWLVSRHATWHVPPLRLASVSRRLFRRDRASRVTASTAPRASLKLSPGRLRASVVAVSKSVGRLTLIAAFAFLALMGVTRFVHVDTATVLRSVHFGIPHFLTPWRSADDPIDLALSSQPSAYPAIPYSPSVTPSTFVAPGSESSSEHAHQDAHLVDDAAKGWIPLPGGGPFPMNMPTYGDDVQKGPVHLTIHPPTFSAPSDRGEEEGNGDAVTLLGTPPSQAQVLAAPAAEPEQSNSQAKKSGPRVLPVHNARESAPVRPSSRPAAQPQTAEPPPPANRDAVDVQLMQAVPKSQPAAPAPAAADSEQQVPQQDPTSTGPVAPKFNVVTKNGDALVVVEHGQMKQVSVGQTLPDGSTLLSVQRHGGGFSTSRGNYVAY